MTYTEAEVFADQKHNSIIDLMYFHLVAWTRTLDPTVDINDIFCLTGKAAAIWQGQTNTPVNNVVFITNNTDCFEFIQKNLPSLLKLPTIVYQEKVLVYAPNLFLEVHFFSGTFNVIFQDFIPVQPILQIPTQFL